MLVFLQGTKYPFCLLVGYIMGFLLLVLWFMVYYLLGYTLAGKLRTKKLIFTLNNVSYVLAVIVD